jgi:hypothetical protein
MATLQIRKKSNKVWLHIASDQQDFIISKFYFNADGLEFQIVEQGQSKRNKYTLANISVYDIGGSAEVFSTMTALSLRLESLKYPAFYRDGESILDSFLDLTDTPSTYIGQSGKLVKVKSGEDGLEFGDPSGFNLKVYETGETPIENIDEIEFDGATVTDDGGGKITVTITGGSTPTLQEVLDEGKTATFTDVNDDVVLINLGEYSEDNFTSEINFSISNSEIDEDYNVTFGISPNSVSLQSSKVEEINSKVSNIGFSNGDVEIFKQNGFESFSKNQSISFEDVTTEPADNLDIVYKPNPKFVSGTYYLATTEDIPTLQEVTDEGNTTTNTIILGDSIDSATLGGGIISVRLDDTAISGEIHQTNLNSVGEITYSREDLSTASILRFSEPVIGADLTLPDAVGTIALTSDIPPAITIDATPTDGSANAVSSNGVFDALALKCNKPLVDTVSSSALTGVTTEGILKSYLIPANTLTASEILNFSNDLYKTGTAGTVTSRLYTNTTASLSGALLLGTNQSTAGSRKIPLRRQLVFKSGNVEVLNATSSTPDDNLNSGTVATIVTFNPTVDNYLITTAQNANAGDSTLQNNLKLHY